MRYLKLASDKNPDTDYIELNDLNGFFCTSFRSIGIKRQFEFLTINNRRFSVDNKIEFKDYSLTIEILSKYSEYENKHRDFISFLDRNKKSGFRLYYRPYDGMQERYIMCDIKSSEKTEKRQPILITLSQNSLWLGDKRSVMTSQTEQQEGNLFAFTQRTVVNDNESVNDDYYSVSFELDESIEDYCVVFYNGAKAIAEISNNCYNEIPLNIKIYGKCINPKVSLFRKNELSPIKELKIKASVDSEHYIEINANILENGVWLVNNNGNKIDYSELIYNEYGSPYFYIDNGEYFVTVEDEGQNVCIAEFSWREEYSE